MRAIRDEEDDMQMNDMRTENSVPKKLLNVRVIIEIHVFEVSERIYAEGIFEPNELFLNSMSVNHSFFKNGSKSQKFPTCMKIKEKLNVVKLRSEVKYLEG